MLSSNRFVMPVLMVVTVTVTTMLLYMAMANISHMTFVLVFVLKCVFPGASTGKVVIIVKKLYGTKNKYFGI